MPKFYLVVVITFPIAVTKYLPRLKVQSITVGKAWQQVTLYPQTGKSHEYQCILSPFTQSRTPVSGIVLPTFRVDLPTSIQSLWKQPHKHTQRWISTGILNPFSWQLRLILKLVRYKWKTYLGSLLKKERGTPLSLVASSVWVRTGCSQIKGALTFRRYLWVSLVIFSTFLGLHVKTVTKILFQETQRPDEAGFAPPAISSPFLPLFSYLAPELHVLPAPLSTPN